MQRRRSLEEVSPPPSCRRRPSTRDCAPPPRPRLPPPRPPPPRPPPPRPRLPPPRPPPPPGEGAVRPSPTSRRSALSIASKSGVSAFRAPLYAALRSRITASVPPSPCAARLASTARDAVRTSERLCRVDSGAKHARGSESNCEPNSHDYNGSGKRQKKKERKKNSPVSQPPRRIDELDTAAGAEGRVRAIRRQLGNELSD